MTAVPRWVLTHRHAVLAGLLAVLLLGLNARFQLPVQLFPDIEPPLVTVITPYPGMAAEDVADNVSQPLEEEFAGIDGVSHLRSTSQEGLSVVEVEFDYDESSADGAVDVQNAINRIRNRLPAALGEPRVQEFSSAERPIVTFALSSNRLDLADIRERAENHVRDRLNLVDGVAMVDIIGAHRSQLTIHLRRDRLLAHAVTQEQVVDTLHQWNLLEPGGRIRRGDQERVVRFDRPLIDAEDAAALVLRREGDALLRLGDVADVRVGPAEPRSGYRHAGESAIAVQVLKRSEANTVAVADRLFATLDELRAENPAIHFAVAEDDSAFTRQVIGSMTATVVGAIALTVLVVLLFLGEVRQATIVAATIPVVFLATFALMRLAGLQLDMVTMSAIILAIGLLVDDSIVILENIHRHAEAGDAPDRAAIHGTGEVLLPKLGGTITTLAVLAPLVLLGGFIGELFRPLSLTLIFALSASFVIAATLVPLLAALWLRRGGEASAPWWPLARFHDLMERLRALYLTLLAVVLRRPGRTLALILVLLVGSAAMLRAGGGEMLPRFDTGSFRVLLDAVPGTPVEQTGELVAEVERALLARDDVTGVSSRLGYEDGARYLGSRGAMDTHQPWRAPCSAPWTARSWPLSINRGSETAISWSATPPPIAPTGAIWPTPC